MGVGGIMTRVGVGVLYCEEVCAMGYISKIDHSASHGFGVRCVRLLTKRRASYVDRGKAPGDCTTDFRLLGSQGFWICCTTRRTSRKWS